MEGYTSKGKYFFGRYATDKGQPERVQGISDTIKGKIYATPSAIDSPLKKTILSNFKNIVLPAR